MGTEARRQGDAPWIAKERTACDLPRCWPRHRFFALVICLNMICIGVQTDQRGARMAEPDGSPRMPPAWIAVESGRAPKPSDHVFCDLAECGRSSVRSFLPVLANSRFSCQRECLRHSQ